MPERTSNLSPLTPLREDDPLPPEDQLTAERLRAELDTLYRAKASPIADQLARWGAKDALDLVHEGFARMLGLAPRKHVTIARPDAYVVTISKNLEKDGGRASARHNAWVEDVFARGGEHHDPVVYLESRDALRRLQAAILKLKPLTRKVFLLRRVEGSSYAEISEVTGLSANAIEKHMSKAIAKLSGLIDRG
jgi:RNA polymerase sigma-70 factor (ECF subfamily)